MTATRTATFKLINTTEGWTGTLTFDLSSAVPAEFIGWCQSQDLVTRTESPSATTCTIHLGPTPVEDDVKMAIADILVEAGLRMPSEQVTHVYQGSHNPLHTPRELTSLERKLLVHGSLAPLPCGPGSDADQSNLPLLPSGWVKLARQRRGLDTPRASRCGRLRSLIAC